jgi:uncharacterized NAD-dependent epimerase/dehydratase family protein
MRDGEDGSIVCEEKIVSAVGTDCFVGKKFLTVSRLTDWRLSS